MMNESLVSIIMPAFNAEKYIKEAIQSVIDQVYPYWELIIVNDGSEDNTEDIIKSFRDIRIKYFKQRNKGVGAARNLALRNILGAYFCFLDADDILPNRSLLSRLKVFEKNSNIRFVDGRVDKRSENLTELKEVFLPNYKGNPFSELVSLNNSCFFGSSWMIKSDSEIQYRFRTDISHSEDLLFYISIAHTGIYSFTEETILIYRDRNNSAMTNLEGLENGYREVYRLVSSLPDTTFSNLVYLKARIIKIMVLSYLSASKFKRALIAAYSLLKL